MGSVKAKYKGVLSFIRRAVRRGGVFEGVADREPERERT
jgi:hypothetical protein